MPGASKWHRPVGRCAPGTDPQGRRLFFASQLHLAGSWDRGIRQRSKKQSGRELSQPVAIITFWARTFTSNSSAHHPAPFIIILRHTSSTLNANYQGVLRDDLEARGLAIGRCLWTVMSEVKDQPDPSQLL